MNQIDEVIPDYNDWSAKAGTYKDEPFDGSDLRAQEPLVKPATYGIATDSYYTQVNGKNIPYYMAISGNLSDVWCSKTIAEKLARVNGLLAEFGVELLILDIYRPIQCQAGSWSFFKEQALQAMPEVNNEERRSWILAYVSDPSFFIKDDPLITANNPILHNRSLLHLAMKQEVFVNYP